MKRFYCTICKRVKRVRVLPSDVFTAIDQSIPSDRLGECDWHTTGRINGRPVTAWKESNPVQAEARMTTRKVSSKGRR